MSEFYNEHKKLINFMGVLVLLSVLALGFGFYALFELYIDPKFYKEKPIPANAAVQKVVVAQRTLTSDGGILKSDLELKTMVERDVPTLAIKGEEEAIDRLPLRKIKEGEILRTHLIKDPEEAWDYVSIGRRYFDRKNYKKSLKHFDKAIEIKPDYVSAHEWKGHAEYKSGNAERAKKSFIRAIELDPKSAYAHGYLAFLLLKEKSYDQALKHGKRATKLDSKDSQAFAYTGIALLNKNQPQKAVTALSTAIDLDPEYAYAQYNRARCYLKLKDFEKSLKDMEAAVKNDKSYADEVLMLKGDMYFVQGDFKKALGLYQECLGLKKGAKKKRINLSKTEIVECHDKIAQCKLKTK